jgi:hypothetical protein
LTEEIIDRFGRIGGIGLEGLVEPVVEQRALDHQSDFPRDVDDQGNAHEHRRRVDGAARKVILDETPKGEQPGVTEQDDRFRVGLGLLESLALLLDQFIELGEIDLNDCGFGLVGRASERDVGIVIGVEADEIDNVANPPAREVDGDPIPRSGDRVQKEASPTSPTGVDSRDFAVFLERKSLLSLMRAARKRL